MTVDPSRIDVLILCGGLGTRLKSVMPDKQKVLAGIGPTSFLNIVVSEAVAQGFRRFVFCTGYGAEQVEKEVRAAHPKGLELEFSPEDKPLGTAGAVKNAERLLRSDAFVILNGDSLCPFEFRAMIAFHQEKKCPASVALVEASPNSDGGFVRTDSDSKIMGFREKSHESSHVYLNAGVYVFDRSVLSHIPNGKPFSIELELFPILIRAGIAGFPTGSRLYDIGTPERLEEFRAYWKIRG